MGRPRYEKLKAIEDQVVAGSDLTKQLLGFARVGKYEMKPIDLNEVVEKSWSMFGRTKKEISVHKKMESPMGRGSGYLTDGAGLHESVRQCLAGHAGRGTCLSGNHDLTIMENDEKSPYMKPGKYVKIRSRTQAWVWTRR